MIAGPFAGMALGELGAEVVKVERSDSGDDTRRFAPFAGAETPYFLSFNREKRGISVDLGAPAGQAVVRRLATDWADVVIENFKDGTLERWNLGLEELRATNPRLITATVRGYPVGDDRPGDHFIIQAGAGIMSVTGPPGGEFYRVGAPVCDLSAGQYILNGILAALYERECSGRGQHVSVSLWEAQVGSLFYLAQEYLMLGKVPARVGNGNASAGPYGIFPTATLPVAVCVGNGSEFAGRQRCSGTPNGSMTRG